MIKPVTLYEGICDGCGKKLEYDGGAITAWYDEGSVYELMQDSEWLEINGKHYCPDCYEYNESIDDCVPKKKGGEKWQQQKRKESKKRLRLSRNR